MPVGEYIRPMGYSSPVGGAYESCYRELNLVGMDWRLTYWRALLGVVLGGAFLGGAVYARKVEPEEVEVVSISLALPRLDVQFDGYRIAQISDIHADDWMTPGRVSRLVDLINAEEPDLVLITGDFATYSPL